jgi:hypothetical protein
LLGVTNTLNTILILEYSMHFLPLNFFKNLMLPATNTHLSDPLSLEDFLHLLLSLDFAQGYITGSLRQDCWASVCSRYFLVHPFGCVPLCHGIDLKPFFSNTFFYSGGTAFI